MRIFTFLTLLLVAANAFSQSLPVGMTPAEKQSLPNYLLQRSVLRGVDPPAVAVRNPAQWEEMQGVLISWQNTDYELLSEIIDYAQEVAQIYILTGDSNDTKSYLDGNGVPLTNLHFIPFNTNSIWARDYGVNSIYENEVTNLSLTDWEYNRPRPRDDTSAVKVAPYLNVPLYETTQSPNRLVHTGGNYMSDGHGTAFSSKLVLDENSPVGDFGQDLTEGEIDSIMKKYLGIKRYIKMETLPYDGIHHIDMHMKLLDEETLLIGEYPSGISDGPQIDANIQYIQDNFLTCFNRPYKIIRIPQPPNVAGTSYPGSPFGGAYYRTYTNALILNGLVLIPGYYEKYDTTAVRIWQEAMPGYQIVQLDCNNIIPQSGTIHCITHEIGFGDPIWISHAKLLDTYQTSGTYEVNAYVNTASGVSGATMYWTLDTTAGYSAVAMTDLGSGDYQAMIPAQPVGTKVFYYVEASSNSGRTARKPLVAPSGVYAFKVLGAPTVVETPTKPFEFFEPYPMPASDLLNVSFFANAATSVTLELSDITGSKLQTIKLNNLDRGVHQHEYNVSSLPVGTYFIQLKDNNGNAATRKFNVAR